MSDDSLGSRYPDAVEIIEDGVDDILRIHESKVGYTGVIRRPLRYRKTKHCAMPAKWTP